MTQRKVIDEAAASGMAASVSGWRPANDPTDLAYWFPLIQAAGLPVPETRIVEAPDDLIYMLDGEEKPGHATFFAAVEAAAVDIGGAPFFLRTGHGSGKHEWDKTCYVADLAAIPYHVAALVEWSECADMLGLPYKTWAVRKLIPTRPLFTAFWTMPIVREFRFFVRDGEVEHVQPYWPEHAIDGHEPSADNWRDLLAEASKLSDEERAALSVLAVAAGSAVGGYWSVDLLQDRDGGWWLTDMAVGERSYRWNPADLEPVETPVDLSDVLAYEEPPDHPAEEPTNTTAPRTAGARPADGG